MKICWSQDWPFTLKCNTYIEMYICCFSDEIVTTMTAKQSLVADSLSPLIRPITRAVFVGKEVGNFAYCHFLCHITTKS